MNKVFLPALLGYLTDFLGLGIGALVAVLAYSLKRKIYKNSDTVWKNIFFSFIFEFSSGLMMAVVTFNLIPTSIEKCKTPLLISGILCGLVFVFFSGRFFEKKYNDKKSSLTLLTNLWLHNIPEGFILGSMTLLDMKSAILFFIIVTLHNIPEGFLIALPIASKNKKSLLYLSLISGLPTVLGAVLGYLTGGMSETLTGFMMAFGAGSMLYVLIFELSFEAHRIYPRKVIEIFYILGLILGIIIV